MPYAEERYAVYVESNDIVLKGAKEEDEAPASDSLPTAAGAPRMLTYADVCYCRRRADYCGHKHIQ
jgi:hypothetical protein